MHTSNQPPLSSTPVLTGLGQALRWLRERQARKQYRVADDAGVTKGMLSAYETGRQRPSLETLDKLLETLGCDLNDLHNALQIVNGRPERMKGWRLREGEPDLASIGALGPVSALSAVGAVGAVGASLHQLPVIDTTSPWGDPRRQPWKEPLHDRAPGKMPSGSARHASPPSPPWPPAAGTPYDRPYASASQGDEIHDGPEDPAAIEPGRPYDAARTTGGAAGPHDANATSKLVGSVSASEATYGTPTAVATEAISAPDLYRTLGLSGHDRPDVTRLPAEQEQAFALMLQGFHGLLRYWHHRLETATATPTPGSAGAVPVADTSPATSRGRTVDADELPGSGRAAGAAAEGGSEGKIVPRPSSPAVAPAKPPKAPAGATPPSSQRPAPPRTGAAKSQPGTPGTTAAVSAGAERRGPPDTEQPRPASSRRGTARGARDDE